MKDKVELSGYTFCKIKLVYVLLRRISNGSQPVSSYNFWTEISFIAPAEICAASNCIFQVLVYHFVCNYPIWYQRVL